MSVVLLSLAFAATSAAAPAPAARAQPAEDAIVITGHSLSETERALRECLARKCPPNQDIDASLAHAENLFVAGKYQEARRVTHASIGRNRRYGKTYPIDVSDLYRANGRIAAHLGEGQDYEFSVVEMHRTLDDALPDTDPRKIEADLEWANMYASFGRLWLASHILHDAAKEADRAGRPDLAGIARVRSAWLLQFDGDRSPTRQALEKLAADTSPSGRTARIAAGVLLARLDRSQNKLDSTNALVEQIRSLHSKQPLLLYAPSLDHSPRLEQGDNARVEAGSTTRLMATDNFDDRWVDIGYWITPDGRVRDAEILRSRGNSSWTKQLLQAIAGRVYAPLEDPTGSYRIERYTYTARYMNVTGTRVRQRSPDARIEFVDLTPDPPAGTH